MQQDRKKLLILCDKETKPVADLFIDVAVKIGKYPELSLLKLNKVHGEEPPLHIGGKMLQYEAVLCLTKFSLAHTNARMKANEARIPFLSMPEYNLDMLNNKAFFVDYHKIMPMVERYAYFLSSGTSLTVKTGKGTNLQIGISERKGNCCPGFTNGKYLLASPPDIEANVAVVESTTNGTLVVDGSITDPSIGILSDTVNLEFNDGRIVSIKSDNVCLRQKLEEIFSRVNSQSAYILGEFGIGFNDQAKLCGNMLIDEGARGCVHFGIGSNWTIGGTNRVNFHLDCLVKHANVEVDGRQIIKEGVLKYE